MGFTTCLYLSMVLCLEDTYHLSAFVFKDLKIPSHSQCGVKHSRVFFSSCLSLLPPSSWIAPFCKMTFSFSFLICLIVPQWGSTCVLKSCHTSMNHYMQENSRMSPHKSIHSSLFIECKGLQWGPQFDLVCPCKYTMKREIQRGKAIVLASMIHQICMKANLNDNDSEQCKI